MGRRGYPPEFRRKVLDPLESGRSAAEVARDLQVSATSRSTAGVDKIASTAAWSRG